MEKIDLSNPNLSEKEKAEYKKLAERLRATAPDDVVIQRLVKSLELDYPDARSSI